MSPLKQVIASPDLPPSLGPYSHAVRAGDFIFLAGQPGLDPESGKVAGGDFRSQANQAFKNLARVLKASGSSMEQVVKTTVFVTDASQFPILNELYSQYFSTNPPARSTPIVQLPRGLLISIECIAISTRSAA
jgi:2-iminobutanoate/2-iminopropanoate deaminase